MALVDVRPADPADHVSCLFDQPVRDRSAPQGFRLVPATHAVGISREGRSPLRNVITINVCLAHLRELRAELDAGVTAVLLGPPARRKVRRAIGRRR